MCRSLSPELEKRNHKGGVEMKLGTTELLIILLVVVIIFGPTQIPKLTRMFGKSVKSFREGIGAEENGQESGAAGNAEEKEI